MPDPNTNSPMPNPQPAPEDTTEEQAQGNEVEESNPDQTQTSADPMADEQEQPYRRLRDRMKEAGEPLAQDDAPRYTPPE